MPLPRIPRRGAIGETARLIQSQFNVTTPPGIVIKQSPTGTEWRDDRLKPFLARITGDGTGSGTGAGAGGPSGSGWTDFNHHYDWEEVFPISINSEALFETKEDGRSGTSSQRPAVEANFVTDVPIDAIVMLYPGPGEPDWYYFWWTGELGSGSGGGMTVTCSDGTSYPVTISGDSITVGDAI